MTIFGDQNLFGIETGEVSFYPESAKVVVQFRFWMANQAIGDWVDRISLYGSILAMRDFCLYSQQRINPECENQPAEHIYSNVYDYFFETECLLPGNGPRLRDVFHMDFIGLGAIEDLYGIILVATSGKMARIIVRDLRRMAIVVDQSLPFGEVERVGYEYIEWGNQQLRQYGQRTV